LLWHTDHWCLVSFSTVFFLIFLLGLHALPLLSACSSHILHGVALLLCLTTFSSQFLPQPQMGKLPFYTIRLCIGGTPNNYTICNSVWISASLWPAYNPLYLLDVFRYFALYISIRDMSSVAEYRPSADRNRALFFCVPSILSCIVYWWMFTCLALMCSGVHWKGTWRYFMSSPHPPSAGVWTQSLTLARQALFHLSHSTSPEDMFIQWVN
jgi:hypothetical protein